MLKINIPAGEFFDSSKSEFIEVKSETLLLEHSLLSISKWEMKWCKPFLTNDTKTIDESIDYIKCMTINDVDEMTYVSINEDIMRQVIDYINMPMTATTFSKNNKENHRIITNELIYYWMFSFGIPKECENWHLSRLLTLIRVFSEENAPKKKMSYKEQLSRQKMLNEARRKKYNTRG